MFTKVIQQKTNIQTSQINFNFIQQTCQQEHVWILGCCSQAHHDWSNKEERSEKESWQYPWKHFNATIMIKVESSKNLSEIFIEQVYIVCLCISQIGFGSMIEKVGLNLWSETGLHNIAPSSSDNQLG